jgi:hypothetical protein
LEAASPALKSAAVAAGRDKFPAEPAADRERPVSCSEEKPAKMTRDESEFIAVKNC